jgi:hypothetical protein
MRLFRRQTPRPINVVYETPMGRFEGSFETVHQAIVFVSCIRNEMGKRYASA